MQTYDSFSYGDMFFPPFFHPITRFRFHMDIQFECSYDDMFLNHMIGLFFFMRADVLKIEYDVLNHTIGSLNSCEQTF